MIISYITMTMDNVQLICFSTGDVHMYAELKDGVLYSGKDRSVYRENLRLVPDSPEWKAYAEGRTFPIRGSTSDAHFRVDCVKYMGQLPGGYLVPVFKGLIHCPNMSFPKFLEKPVAPLKQPAVVGVAPKTSEQLRYEREQQERYERERWASLSRAEKAKETADIRAVERDFFGI